MGWGTLPAPGTELGPCEGECAHTDCAETRRMAASACARCGEEIGYDRAFYARGEGFVHAACAWAEEAERRRAMKGGDHG